MRGTTVISMAAADASANINGAAISTYQLFYCSAQIVVTGSSTGTLKLQFSNDVTTVGQVPTNWTDITSASSVVAGAGVTGILKIELCYNYIRAVWTKNNGSAGTVSVNIQVMGN